VVAFNPTVGAALIREGGRVSDRRALLNVEGKRKRERCGEVRKYQNSYFFSKEGMDGFDGRIAPSDRKEEAWGDLNQGNRKEKNGGNFGKSTKKKEKKAPLKTGRKVS